ncbi:MAG: DUF3592 domain-containing protein [Raineya sp.]|jgi:hypothetical protein|nr:DUF3592 domain-containing protein [Raineya sp.]
MLIGIFAFLISIVCFWASQRLIRLYLNVKKWNRIEAQIISKEVVYDANLLGGSSACSKYTVKTEYQYEFKDKTYTNSKIMLAELLGGRFATLEWQAKKIAERITNPIKIYVNPHKPQESVIFCEGITLYFIIAFMGFVAFLIGLVNII